MKIKNITVEIHYKVHASPQNDWQEEYGVETKKTFSASDIGRMVYWLDSQDKWIGWDHNDHLIGERGGSPRSWGDVTQRAIFSPMNRNLKDQITKAFSPQRLRKDMVNYYDNRVNSQRVATRYLSKKSSSFDIYELSSALHWFAHTKVTHGKRRLFKHYRNVGISISKRDFAEYRKWNRVRGMEYGEFVGFTLSSELDHFGSGARPTYEDFIDQFLAKYGFEHMNHQQLLAVWKMMGSKNVDPVLFR